MIKDVRLETKRAMRAVESAERFMAANKESPVMEFRVAHVEGGGFFRLADGRSFRLSRAACKRLRRGFPRWAKVK